MKNNMDITKFLFSFNGRVGRMHYWMFTIPVMAILILPSVSIFKNNPEAYETYETIALLVLIWPGLAVQAKRWHDRNKSTWWLLINIVPIIGGVWALVENGFLPGDIGDNQYGEDPYAYLDNEENPNKSLKNGRY